MRNMETKLENIERLMQQLLSTQSSAGQPASSTNGGDEGIKADEATRTRKDDNTEYGNDDTDHNAGSEEGHRDRTSRVVDHDAADWSGDDDNNGDNDSQDNDANSDEDDSDDDGNGNDNVNDVSRFHLHVPLSAAISSGSPSANTLVHACWGL